VFIIEVVSAINIVSRQTISPMRRMTTKDKNYNPLSDLKIFQSSNPILKRISPDTSPEQANKVKKIEGICRVLLNLKDEKDRKLDNK
jgi:hypothetical protein